MVETMQLITADELRERMKSNNRPVLINALSKDSYIAKHIPGSINIPEEHADWIENVVPDKQQDIVVYCANSDCDASPNTAKKMIEMGYENIWDFEEGLAGWKKSGYELVGQDRS